MESERIFADTNLFLRYLTNDIPEQAEAFDKLLKRADAGEVILVANSLVMAEIVWTLESYYELPRGEIQRHVLAILNTPGMEIWDDEILLQATIWYVEKNIDFIDAFNAAWMLDRGLTTVCTFDQKHFGRIESVRAVLPE